MDGIVEILLLIVTGLIAGIIDSIVGGGGLITVPLLTILIGPGASAIGTNKIAAVCASLFAFLVYLRGGHLIVQGQRAFVFLVGLGALAGARLAPAVPAELYKSLLLVICPVMLWVVYRKDLWIRATTEIKPRPALLMILGLACGFYDGIAGPGGGTLMFLSLFVVAKLPLLAAIATAKIANLSSAGVSLASFSVSGHVLWIEGGWLALGISIGALIGANVATRVQSAAPLARVALLSIAGLLAFRLMFA